MPRILIKLWLFLSSYSLLFVIVGLLQYKYHPYVSISLWLMAFFSILITRIYLKIIETKFAPIYRKLTDFKKKDNELAAYLVTYVVPFLTLPFSNVFEFIAIIILFISIFVLYTTTDMVYVNPVFSIFGYKIYEAKTEDGINIILISKEVKWKPDFTALVVIGDQVYIELRKK